MPSMILKFDQQKLAELALRGEGTRKLVAEAGARAQAQVPDSELIIGGNNRARAIVERPSIADEGRDGALARALRNAGVR